MKMKTANLFALAIVAALWGSSGARADVNGLMGMRERVEAIGGELRLQSANGEGTLLELRVPWRAPPAPGAASGDAHTPRRLVAVR